jgi:hypothetical protein
VLRSHVEGKHSTLILFCFKFNIFESVFMKVNQFNISWPVGELGEECKPEKTICLLVMVDNQINDPGPLHIYLKYL